MTLNEKGGLEHSDDLDIRSADALDPKSKGFPAPTMVLSDPYVENFVSAQLLGGEGRPEEHWLKNVLMVVTRTRNHNIVVYSANLASDGKGLDPENPFNICWYDIAPNFIKNHRKKGELSDHVAFGAFDYFGFGLKAVDYWQQRGETVLYMSSVPDSVFPLGVKDTEGSLPGPFGLLKAGQFKLVWVEAASCARFIAVLCGRQCYMEKMYVATRERKFNPIPIISMLRIFGIDVTTGEPRHEDFFP